MRIGYVSDCYKNKWQKCAKIKWSWSQIRTQTYRLPSDHIDDLTAVRLFNITLCHALDHTQLAWDASEMVSILQAAETLVKYLKKSGLAAVLSKQFSKWGTSGSAPSISLTPVVYQELCEKLEGHGENCRIDAISLEILNFLVESL